MKARVRGVCLAVITAAAIFAVAAAAAPKGVPVPAGYNGPEAKLPTAFPTPTKKAGTKCTIGFQNPVAANETLGAWQKAVVAQGKKNGVELRISEKAWRTKACGRR